MIGKETTARPLAQAETGGSGSNSESHASKTGSGTKSSAAKSTAAKSSGTKASSAKSSSAKSSATQSGAAKSAGSAKSGSAKSGSAKSGGAKAGQKKQAPTVRVRLVRSAAGKKSGQRATLTGLGLKKPGQVRELEDTPAVRGMIYTVGHLVQVESK